MANFSLYVNSKFKPFSYQEMLAPALMATQAHQELENMYGEVGDNMESIGSRINQVRDKKTYDRYKSFEENLSKEADELSKKGLSPSSRKRALDLRRAYYNAIIPIKTAIENKSKIAEEQRKLLADNPSLMFDRDFSVISLDDLIDNPDIKYTPISGNELYAKGKEAATAASSRNIQVLSALSGQYWKIKKGYGKDIANAFLLDNAKIPELNDAINRIISQSGVTNNNRARAIDYAISGIMAGLTYDEGYQANRAYVDPAERERLTLAREQFEWSKDRWEDEQLGTKLPNGNRVKDIGGGRVRITHPNGDVEVIATPKSSDLGKGNKDKKPFSGLQFKMWDNSSATTDFQEGLSNVEWTTKKKGFDTGDEKQISFSDLSSSMQTNIAAKLAEYGLTFDDVEVWRDHDTFSDDHYQVRLKQRKPESIEGFGGL